MAELKPRTIIEFADLLANGFDNADGNAREDCTSGLTDSQSLGVRRRA